MPEGVVRRPLFGEQQRFMLLLIVPAALLLTLFQVDSTILGEVVLVSLEHHLADAFEVSVYRRGPGETSE